MTTPKELGVQLEAALNDLRAGKGDPLAVIEDIANTLQTAPDPYLALWFDPVAIREHFADDDEYEWVADLSDETLTKVGGIALTDDFIYDEFRRALRNALNDLKEGN